MERYENGPVAGWVGYARGNGWVDFFHEDGSTLRFHSATDECEPVGRWR